MSDEEQVGSLGEEAAKLLEALQGWARQGEQTGQQAAAGAASFLHDVDEHLATGGADCTYCPLCRVIAAVRGTSPEVRQHLGAAATSLAQAAAGFFAPPRPPGHDGSEPDAQKTGPDDEDEWEDD